MHNQQLQLTLPDDEAGPRPRPKAPGQRAGSGQPAVALPQPAQPTRPADLSLREADHLYSRRIRDLPPAEQPITRLNHYGAGVLGTSELLAILLGAPYLADADHVLGAADGLSGLARMTFAELVALQGVGEATAARIKAAFELGRRVLAAVPAERPQVRSPADVANLLMAEMSTLDQEELRIVILDTRNRIMAVETLYRGSLNTASVRVGEVFKGAIRRNAAAIIICHNHPSNDPTPSPEDVQVTRLIVEAGQLLNVDVLDHLILGGQRFVSLKERGLGFK
jgi:DNA repair protein RadC